MPKAAKTPKTEEAKEPIDHIRNIPAGGIAISEEDAETLEKPIDDRMAALLKDHQRMGARPK